MDLKLMKENKDMKIKFSFILFSLNSVKINIFTCCCNKKIRMKIGHDASQKFMLPSLCPDIYKFATFENPPNWTVFKYASSFDFNSGRKREGMSFIR